MRAPMRARQRITEAAGRNGGFGPERGAALLRQGYLWLPRARERAGGCPVQVRLGGKRVTGLEGPEALRFFYDEKHVRRHGALPEPVLSTLFGHGAVHTLDGEAHHRRKELFLDLLTLDRAPVAVGELVARTAETWDRAATGWAAQDEVVLFDAVAEVLTASVCEWAGIPLVDDEIPALAHDLVAMVDGFATGGPRLWRARLARGRRERWLATMVDSVRSGALAAPTGRALAAVCEHVDADGAPLSARVAAVELLNVIRPTVAVTWFVTYAAHALHWWPHHRERLALGDQAFARAFTHELRRYYPFAPFVGGAAVTDLEWQGAQIPEGSTVVVDLYGQDHDERLFPDPGEFRPERFLDREIGPFELVPQGGGDPATGHRCPGEQITIALLELLTVRLARLHHDVPEQDLSIPAARIPARVTSGYVMTRVSPPPVIDHRPPA
jgi:fatty-acid peroxygenase